MIAPPTNSVNTHLQSDGINLSELLDTLLQRIWLICGFLVFAVLLGATYATLTTPIYKADALIQVEDQKSSAIGGMQEVAEALGGGSSSVSGEVEILRSREVILQAVAATKADILISVDNRFPLIGDWYARRFGNINELSDPLFGLSHFAWGGEQLELAEFSVPEHMYEARFSLVKSESGYKLLDVDSNLLAEGVEGRAVDFTIAGEPARIGVRFLRANVGTSFSVSRIAPFNAYSRILSNLSVGEVGKLSSIIRVTYQHPNVKHANAVVNAIANAYLSQNVERRSAEADQSLIFLDEQLPQIKQNVEEAEEALNAFRTRTNTVSVEKATETLLGQAVEVERGRLELELQRDALLQRYKPTHPAVRSIDEQLEATRRATVKVNDEVNSLPAAQRDLLRLQRDADVSTQLYTALLNSAQQLRIAKAGTVGNVRVIDFAIPNRNPISPNKPVILLVSIMIGLMLGVFAALALRMLRPTIRDASAAEKATQLAVYATIPESEMQKKLDLQHRRVRTSSDVTSLSPSVLARTYPNDPAVESLRSLRTGLAFALMGVGNGNIVITGATASLGKSFISANLGILLAEANKKILLIETDLRRPQLGKYFGYGKVSGLSDVLAGKQLLDEVLLKRLIEGVTLDVLPSGTIPPNPGELLLSSRFAELVESLQHSYDHILFDSAPLLPVADTLAVVQRADTVFLVARAEQTTALELRDAQRKLEAVGVYAKGVIFNGVKRNRVGYGYAYKYYYGYGK